MKTTYSFLFLIIILLAGCKSEERKAEERFEARKMLSDIGVEFTIDEFHDRIEEGDYSAVELFLKAGMSPNAGNKAGYLAIDNGHITILKLLIKNGYQLDPNGTGIVLSAIREMNIEILELLKNEGADFNINHEIELFRGEISRNLPLTYALDRNRNFSGYGPRGGQYDSYDRKYYEVAEWLIDNGARLKGWQRGDAPLTEIYLTEDLEDEAPSLYQKLKSY
jgi:hypothetical protein